MKICIIGASGYVGGWITESLKNKGHDLTAVYRNEPICNHDWKSGIQKIIVGDITDVNVLNSIIETEPEVIIFLISLNHIQSENNFFNTLKINVSPLGYLVKELSKSIFFKKFIYFSTLQVLGKISNGDIIDENSQAKPTNNYGLTHFFCEEFLKMQNRINGFDFTIIRLANSYGPAKYDSCDILWLVINDFCISAINDKVIKLKSDGSPLRDFIYITDVANSVNYIVNNYHESPNIVNICSGKTYSIVELAHLVKNQFKKFGYNVPILLPNGIESENPNIHSQLIKYQIKSWLIEIGQKPEITLELGIEKTIQNLLNAKNL